MYTKKMMEQKTGLEALLLNTMLNYSEAFMDVIGLIPSENIFDKPEHSFIFNEAVKYFTEKGKAPNFLDIYNMQITSKENRESIINYLNKVLINTGTELRDVRNLTLRIIEIKAEFEQRNFQANCLEKGMDYINAVSEYALETTTRYFSGCKKERSNLEVGETVITNIMNGTGDSYIKTGFLCIDKFTNGLPKGHLTILAGRPGMGKTDIMLQLLRQLLDQNLRVGIFSLEMSAELLFMRNLSSCTEIDSLRLESGQLSKEEKQKIMKTVPMLTSDNYKVVDLSVQTPSTIKAQIHLWKIRDEVDVILLDYLTLISTNYKQTRQDLEIGKLSAELNQLAKSTGLPIVICSQLNRMSESRNNKRPQLSDLRESGSIEQDAAVVLLLFRPGLYNIDAARNSDYRYETLEGSPLNMKEYFEVIIAKCRNGRTGSVVLRYKPEIHTFEAVRAEKIQGEDVFSEYEEHFN